MKRRKNDENDERMTKKRQKNDENDEKKTIISYKKITMKKRSFLT